MTDSKIAAIVTQFVYPDDREIRVRKFAITLRALGYQVHVLCGSNGHNFDFIDQDGNIIHRINVCWQLPFIHRILKASFPTNPIWYIWILLTCWKNKINFILVRDLRLSHPGLIAGKILGIPRIIDFGEDFPSLYKIVGYSEILIKLSCWLEKLAINLADKVTVVSEESKQKLEDDYVISPNKIITLPNVPAPSLVWDWGSTIPYETFPNAKNELKLIFLGLVDQLRGLELVLHGMTALNQVGVKHRLTIIGDGNHMSHIKDLAVQNRVQNQIDFMGWISGDKYKILRQHHIGLIPHIDSKFTQTTLPNKLFDYMSVGLPVVSTDLVPVARIITECQCGWVVKQDSGELACLLKELVANPGELYRRGQNGFQKILTKYNWDIQAKSIYQAILGN